VASLMREPSVRCFIEPRRDEGKDERPDADTAPGLVALPESLLLRHGARVLDPATAVSIPGSPPPRSTVYRARTLLVPGNLLVGGGGGVKNKVLAEVGMGLAAPGARERAGREGLGGELGGRLPRPPVLPPRPPRTGGAAPPAVVDAWI